MRYLATVILILGSTQAFAKKSCTARELNRQDCRLSSGSYTIRLLTETIARDDGTWQTVDPMPLKENAVWEKAQFDIQHGVPLLQLWIWDGGKGEASVQSLRWYVADARKGALKILSEGVVRRRRVKPVEGAAGGAPKPSFLYDGWETHSAKVSKNGKIDWQLGAQKKTIELPDDERGH